MASRESEIVEICLLAAPPNAKLRRVGEEMACASSGAIWRGINEHRRHSRRAIDEFTTRRASSAHARP